MAINCRGDIAGSVGGGVVEFECMKLALQVIASGVPVLKDFSLKGEIDGGSGLPCGGICGGTLSVFIEPIVTEKDAVIADPGHIPEKIGN
jgi:xanthine dehydrogenase accessory factor